MAETKEDLIAANELGRVMYAMRMLSTAFQMMYINAPMDIVFRLFQDCHDALESLREKPEEKSAGVTLQ